MIIFLLTFLTRDWFLWNDNKLWISGHFWSFRIHHIFYTTSAHFIPVCPTLIPVPVRMILDQQQWCTGTRYRCFTTSLVWVIQYLFESPQDVNRFRRTHRKVQWIKCWKNKIRFFFPQFYRKIHSALAHLLSTFYASAFCIFLVC